MSISLFSQVVPLFLLESWSEIATEHCATYVTDQALIVDTNSFPSQSMQTDIQLHFYTRSTEHANNDNVKISQAGPPPSRTPPRPQVVLQFIAVLPLKS